MKKILVLCLLAVLTFPLMACGNSAEQRKEVCASVEEFYQNSEYAQIITGEIVYNSTVEEVKGDDSSPYYVLNYYENLLKISLVTPQKYIGSFNVEPVQNTGKTGGLCNKITSSLDKFIEKIADFNSQKQIFVDRIATLDVSGDFALAYFKDFEDSFVELILQANEFNMNFSTAYSTLYGADLTSTPTVDNLTSLVCEDFAKSLDAFITYSFEEAGERLGLEQPDMFFKLCELGEKLKSQQINTSGYADWNKVKTAYANELDMFNQCLKRVDLKKEFEEANVVFYDKIGTFLTSSAPLFLQKTIELF